MKKILLEIITIIIVCLLTTNKVKAFDFIKAPDNPLSVSYINNYVSQLQANIFKEGDVYKGIFVINRPPETYYSLGYFESVNGIDWQMKKEILNTGVDLSNPSILKTPTGYLMFITRFDNNTVYRIYSSNCDINFNCSPNLLPVIVPDLGNNSESYGVFAGHPYQQNSRTYLFFGAWGGDDFKLKLAYSDDLTNWQRCPNAFLYGGDGPYPYQENNDLYLFFHRSDSSGIKLAKTILPLSCDSVFADQGYLLIRDKPYDQKHLIFPSVINENDSLKLYYSGLGADNKWHLNLANSCRGQACLIPTIIPKQPIIIIPGLMASWNYEAIIHNAPQPQSDWQLNPIVNEYKGIVNTLKNLGYEESKNLFVFAYDWRKPVLEIVDDLNNFVNDSSTSLKTSRFSIIGHSLGGLIGRIYLQKFSNSNINKLITVGSPHYGTSQTYKIVEAGEVDRFNNYLWLAVKLVAALNKNNLETDKQTLSRLFPIMKDLFPVYNFLKKDGNEINISDMKIKNELLSNESYKINESNLTHLTTVIGEKGNTLKGYNISPQTFIDKLLDNYPDGRPQSSFSEIGDYTVLSTSATVGTPVILNLEHGELIYKKTGIKKILDLLNIFHNDLQVVEGKGTIINSSLIFLIKSPATMEVVFDGLSYLEQDGIIFIEDAQNGDYQLKVRGIDKGNYEIIVGQTGQNNDIWENIFGETSLDQTDIYNIHYQRDSLQSILVDDLFTYLKIKGYQFKNLKNLTKLYYDLIKNRDFIGLEKLENYELKLNNQVKTNPEQIKKEQVRIEEKLKQLKKPVDTLVLDQIAKRLNIVKEKFDVGNYRYGQILLNTIEKLIKIVKK